ncbi:MAG: DUF4280 domain-containing protein [Oscillospiraceae bacterium]
MANLVVQTAICQCTFGVAPAPLTVTSQQTVTGVNQLAATIMDIPKPPTSFGMCSSPGNPAVITATAQSRGIFWPVPFVPGPYVPVPCMPACTPWTPGSPTVLINNFPALNNTSKCMCSFGGVININMTPALTIQVP